MLTAVVETLVSEAAAADADVDCVVSDEISAVAGGDEPPCVVTDDVRPVAGGDDAAFVVSDDVRAVARISDAASVVSDEVRDLAAGAGDGGTSVLVPVSSPPGDDVFRAFADVLCSPLRNRRHVSELCSEPAALLVTAGFTPSALLVSASS